MVKIARHCDMNPGTKVGIFREDLSDLKKSTLPEWKDLFGDFGNHNHNENTFYFDNGSTVLFHQLSELRKLRNHNLSAGLIEQAEETNESSFWYLVGRLRRDDADHRWLGCLSNPEGHDWIWNLWYNRDIPQPDQQTASELEELELEAPGAEDFHKINASTWSNAQNLPDDYLQGLASMQESMKKKYVHGSRDVLEGAVYPQLSPDTHLIDPFEVPQEWPKYMALDYGDQNPTATLWFTMDYEDRIYVYREHYKARGDNDKEWIISEHKEAMWDAELNEAQLTCPYREQIRGRFIDPACTAKNREKKGKKVSVAEEFGMSPNPMNFGQWRRANSRKEKLAQINRVGELIKKQDEYEHPETSESPAPRLYIFNTCPNTWEEMTQYKWKQQSKRNEGKKNMPEEPQKKDDHTCDALRGFAAQKLMGPKKENKAPVGSFDYIRNKHIMKKEKKKYRPDYSFSL